MSSTIDWKTDSENYVMGVGFHDGYFYGLVQDEPGLVIYTNTAAGEPRKIELSDLTELNVMDFWIGNIIGGVWLYKLAEVPWLMWEKLFAGRIAPHDAEGSLKKLIERAKGRYFFSLEGTYGGNVYAVCDQMRITDESYSARATEEGSKHITST